MNARAWRASALAAGTVVLATSLAACGGSSGPANVSPSVSPSASSTASASPRPKAVGEPVYITLTPSQAAKAKRRLAGDPGVAGTLYDAGPERFYVYYTADVTNAERQHVRHVLYGVLGS